MRHLGKYIIMIFIAALLSSCRNDDGNGNDMSEHSHTIIFSMSLEKNNTRGEHWKDEYTKEQGNYFENKILPDALRVSIFTQDNIKIGEVEDIYYWPINEERTEYSFAGTMPERFAAHLFASIEQGLSLTYKIMILANCPQGDEKDLTYSHTCLDKENGAIPMWGIKTVDLSELASAQSTDVGTIKLLRSAAKLEVKLADALKENGTVINDAYINYYNQTGYCLPTGWDKVNNTEDLNITDCFRLYRHAAVKHTFNKESDAIFNTYVAEYNNADDIYAEERAKITLDITHNGQRRLIEDAISFCQYSNGSPVEGSDYNIIRNHIYRYNIVKISGDNILLEYSVADWDTEEWGDGKDYEEHELTYPTYHNPVIPKSHFDIIPTPETISEEPTMYYNSANPIEGAFECYFQITAPEGVQWKPNFMGSKENYTIQVYDNENTLVFDSDNKNDDIHECAHNEWYKILIYPKNDTGAGEATVDFGIVYWQTWSSSYINLYINGEYDNIRWPSSGNNPKLISIKHIAN